MILHNISEITKQKHDAIILFLLFYCQVTWGRTWVHQLLVFHLLALCLGSIELTGSAVEKDRQGCPGSETQGGEKGKNTEITVKCLW